MKNHDSQASGERREVVMKFAQMIEVARVSSTQFQLATLSLGEFSKLPGMRIFVSNSLHTSWTHQKNV
jgi:hypothetical protein